MAVEFMKIPPRSEVGYLPEDIAREGQNAWRDASGDEEVWSAPAPKPVIPDWSQVKTIKHYFNRTGFAPWPAWIYHPIEAPKLVKDAKEAREYGVVYRETTQAEYERFGTKATWDYVDGSEWRWKPFPKDLKFDPAKQHSGKEVTIGKPNPTNVQNELVKALIPEVAAAVAKAMHGNGPSAPKNVDQKDWLEFQEFLAWKKSGEALSAIAEEAQAEAKAAHTNALAEAMAEEDEPQTDEWALWKAEAEARGIHVDSRWSLKTLKSKIEQAA